MKNNELKTIVGGATNYTYGSFLNSIIRVLTIFLEIGRNIGSALNYNKNKKTC